MFDDLSMFGWMLAAACLGAISGGITGKIVWEVDHRRRSSRAWLFTCACGLTSILAGTAMIFTSWQAIVILPVLTPYVSVWFRKLIEWCLGDAGAFDRTGFHVTEGFLVNMGAFCGMVACAFACVLGSLYGVPTAILSLTVGTLILPICAMGVTLSAATLLACVEFTWLSRGWSAVQEVLVRVGNCVTDKFIPSR